MDGKYGWHGDPGHSGFDPDIYSAEARFGGGTEMLIEVKEFQGEFRFLSNFYPSLLTHDGIKYPTVEHAYQAAKTLDFAKRWEISQLDTPGKAKRAGKQVVLRPDWNDIRGRVMGELIVLKFTFNLELRKKLLATEHAQLTEGNTWGDTYWGICKGKGENVLGQILMMVRGLLR